jgi:putative transposase
MQVAGAAYHVTARAVAGGPLFRDDPDRHRFLELFGDVVARCEWSCHAYCLMSTHYHLLIRTPLPNLAIGMQRLNSCYSQEFNRRHGAEGHRFFRRYHDVMVESDSHALELLRYIALNPVRAGACDQAKSWRWGSYRALIGEAPTPTFLATPWVLSYFGNDQSRAQRRLAAFVEDVSR